MIIEIPKVESLEDLRRRINEVLRLIDERLSGGVVASKPVSGLENRFYADMTVLQNIKEHHYLEDLATKIKDIIQNISGTFKVKTTLSTAVVEACGVPVISVNCSTTLVSTQIDVRKPINVYRGTAEPQYWLERDVGAIRYGWYEAINVSGYFALCRAQDGVYKCIPFWVDVSAPSLCLRILQDAIQAKGYRSADGSLGVTADRTFVDYSGRTHNVTIKNGLITSWTVT